MKKRSKSKSSFASRQAGPDVAELILKVQQQLSFLERKIDTLIGQSAEKPFTTLEKPIGSLTGFTGQQHPKPFQSFEHSRSRPEARRENNYAQRTLHKAICADCNKECEVPFRPSQDRPVYCKDCFAKRKAGGPYKTNADKGPREAGPFQASRVDRPYGGEKKKFFGKKRPAAKRRRPRA